RCATIVPKNSEDRTTTTRPAAGAAERRFRGEAEPLETAIHNAYREAIFDARRRRHSFNRPVHECGNSPSGIAWCSVGAAGNAVLRADQSKKRRGHQSSIRLETR